MVLMRIGGLAHMVNVYVDIKEFTTVLNCVGIGIDKILQIIDVTRLKYF